VSFRGYDINYVGLDEDKFYNDVWQYADGFHFLGNDLKNRALKRGYAMQGTVAIIPSAVNTAFFSKIDPIDITEKAKLSILSTGRLTWKKGYEYAIHAMRILKERQIPFKYTIIGDGNHKQALQFIIAELGLKADITLAGHKNRQQIKEALQSADIFIQPSISEGFCNAVIEAQAMGVAVVATDADGLKENIADGSTGFIVPKWNANAIADKIEWAYKNQPALKGMGVKGISRANQLFRLEDQVKAFIDFYNEVNGAR